MKAARPRRTAAHTHCIDTELGVYTLSGMANRYAVKKHKGIRSRGLVSLTLADEELHALDALAAHEGMTRSRAVAWLVLREWKSLSSAGQAILEEELAARLAARMRKAG